jgi:hypothetical protein
MLRIACLLLFVASFFQAPAQAQAPGGEPDDVADLAGVLVYGNTGSGRLNTTPGEEADVLQALGAVPVSSTRYRADVGGLPVTFDILRTELPGLYQLPTDLICSNAEVQVFRNRKCKETAPSKFTYCLPYGNGQYATYLQFPTRSCEADTSGGYCVEYTKAWGTRDIWSDSQCTIKVRQDVYKKYVC